MKSYAVQFLIKARENLAVAKDSLARGQVNAAANRLYYAAHQAMLGCLHHITGFRAPATNEHRVVLDSFHAEFVVQGTVVDEATFRRVAELKNKRIQADCKPTSVTPAEMMPLFSALAPAIEAIVDFAERREERQ